MKKAVKYIDFIIILKKYTGNKKIKNEKMKKNIFKIAKWWYNKKSKIKIIIMLNRKKVYGGLIIWKKNFQWAMIR